MAKKLIAVTNVRHNGDDIEAGSEVDTSKFTKDELKSLYDSGAVRVEDSGGLEGSSKNGPDTSMAASPENPQGQDAQQVGDVPASQKTATATASGSKSTDSKK